MAVAPNKVRGNLVIDRGLKKELEEIAANQHRSFNNLVNLILTEYVQNLKERKDQ